MKIFKTKAKKLAGTDFYEVRKKAFKIYSTIRSKSKRRVYVRSAYFYKDKVFIAPFWQHLFEKEKWQDRMRRLQYFKAGIELVRHCQLDPISKENPNKKKEILHRFTGETKDKHIFYVQIKENKSSGEKNLISIFPEK